MPGPFTSHFVSIETQDRSVHIVVVCLNRYSVDLLAELNIFAFVYV